MHSISVVVDRLVMREGIERRLTESMETALGLAEGVAELMIMPQDAEADEEPQTITFSQHTVPALRRQVIRRAGSPQLLLQLAVWGVPVVRRIGVGVRG